MILSANDLKTKGISFVEKLIKKYNEVFITVRGKKKFVILPVEEYEKLKEAELDKIIKEAEEDYKKGRYIKETAEEHFQRLGI
ncbi:prevent-host-death family protein [Deferribacter desulfuricans SSM1]|uniref:Antitoxin n=1 Tax=Deferribacter desulfuricans (strain DSM 14783 / JCM 11476 / NBRC 101012 / SSM1) TaxID=639282 RepID=D3PBR0_DEFDS|nr:type II toxin-antitoxin system prevent-host-death family antitoxin [Deferribacter desulfuricans]BAI80033.1 prevent-host-death family protein [Deferribacter desulfuricans SSM1]